jgi:hypothetical protein
MWRILSKIYIMNTTHLSERQYFNKIFLKEVGFLFLKISLYYTYMILQNA